MIAFGTQAQFLAHPDHVPDISPQVVDVVEFAIGEAHPEDLHRLDRDVPELGHRERHVRLRDRHSPGVLVPHPARENALAHVGVDQAHPHRERESASVAAHSAASEDVP